MILVYVRWSCFKHQSAGLACFLQPCSAIHRWVQRRQSWLHQWVILPCSRYSKARKDRTVEDMNTVQRQGDGGAISGPKDR